MAQGAPTATIDNPVINSPFVEPQRHFVMADGQPTGEIDDRRRPSEFFVPVPPPRKRVAEQTMLDLYGVTRQESNEIVNEIRQAVARWRQQGYPHATTVSKDLLAYWQSDDRQRRLFFCQIEAAETAVYLTEAAEKLGDTNATNQITLNNAHYNAGLPRLAFKMATGSGKTVVMAMLIAWQMLNKQANPQDRRYSDKFLVVTPGITIRDRLRVLLPNDPQNYYQAMDLVPAEQIDRLKSGTIVITNYHAFIRREKVQVASLDKKILAAGKVDDAFKESPAEMVRRVCRDFGNAKNIVVINDEAHHCYAPAPKEESEEAALSADERQLAKQDQEEARVWLTGLQAVSEKLGIRSVFDLSATPFFLKGSGYREGTLFPWVVSDFGLMDAIESGIVKIPRVPTSDDSMTGTGPMYRDLWLRVRDALPRKGLKDTPIDGQPVIPKELEGALRTLYADYERDFDAWADAGIGTPPVFIVVCSNTATSKLVYDWIAGWEKDDGVVVPGNLALFSNEQDQQDARSTEHDPGRLRAAGQGRGARPGVQEGGRGGDRDVQARVRRAFPRPQRRRHHAGDDPARGDEHRRQARPAGRAHPLRRECRDADRGLGRQHGHPHPGHPRLRHPAAVRAGRGSRPAPRELRRRRERHVRAAVRGGLRRPVLVPVSGGAGEGQSGQAGHGRQGAAGAVWTCASSSRGWLATGSRCRPNTWSPASTTRRSSSCRRRR